MIPSVLASLDLPSLFPDPERGDVLFSGFFFFFLKLSDGPLIVFGFI